MDEVQGTLQQRPCVSRLARSAACGRGLHTLRPGMGMEGAERPVALTTARCSREASEVSALLL